MVAVFLSVELLYETLRMNGITTNLIVANVTILHPLKTSEN